MIDERRLFRSVLTYFPGNGFIDLDPFFLFFLSDDDLYMHVSCHDRDLSHTVLNC